MLRKAALQQGHTPNNSSCAKRGKIKFQDQRLHPAVLNGQASTLQDRHLWKALCRAWEVVKAAPGFRRTTTWKKIPAVLPYLQERYREQAKAILRKVASPENAEALVVFLHLAIDQQSRPNSQERTKAWKKETRASNQAQSKWLAKQHTNRNFARRFQWDCDHRLPCWSE